jgi:hypothetical protein
MSVEKEDQPPATRKRRALAEPADEAEDKSIPPNKPSTTPKAAGKGKKPRQPGLWEDTSETSSEEASAKPKTTRRRSTGNTEE